VDLAQAPRPLTQALSPPGKYVSHLPALFALLALVASIHRRHLTGDALFLGNFDRLNSFLNTLWLQVHGWKSGHFSGWDDSLRDVFGDRWQKNGFYKTHKLLEPTPLMGETQIKLLFHAFYPWNKVEAVEAH
jgi:hypothetical protein